MLFCETSEQTEDKQAHAMKHQATVDFLHQGLHALEVRLPGG
jgi:hypothetical protein